MKTSLLILLLVLVVSGCTPSEKVCSEPTKYDEQVQSCGCKYVYKTKCGGYAGHSIFYCNRHANNLEENQQIAKSTIQNLQEHGTLFNENKT